MATKLKSFTKNQNKDIWTYIQKDKRKAVIKVSINSKLFQM